MQSYRKHNKKKTEEMFSFHFEDSWNRAENLVLTKYKGYNKVLYCCSVNIFSVTKKRIDISVSDLIVIFNVKVQHIYNTHSA